MCDLGVAPALDVVVPAATKPSGAICEYIGRPMALPAGLSGKTVEPVPCVTHLGDLCSRISARGSGIIAVLF